ncbi:MAG: 3-deoxy-D-manno-octulosonic acid transferase [Planctomycetes bacterium]|nr:3-deoxy-D-manno-octulosonic acid transferase [Planctomycetota bacterium]
MSILIDLIYLFVVCLGWPYLIYRRFSQKRSRLALGERFGKVPSRPVSGHCVWIHGVSLGEINATRTIVAELHRRVPDGVIVISSTTQTGLDRARNLYPHLPVFRFPLDFSLILRRVLRHIRPSVLVLMELEVWPNLIEVTTKRGIPVIIANGRLTSEKSLRRFNWPVIRWFARRMFAKLRWVGAQDRTYAARFIELGVPGERVEVTGSVKYDVAEVTDRIEGQDELAAAMGIDPTQPLWVCGSTGPGEEAIVLEAYDSLLGEFPDLQLAIIPRKPERFDEVAKLIVERGFACLRRSTGAPLVPAAGPAPRPVFLGDTMGELRKFYALARVVFVGRSLVPLGGSDLMEVAGLAKPMLVGPHTENFTEAVNLLLAEGGCRRVGSQQRLANAVTDLLRHRERRARMGQAAREAILTQRGATARTVDRIVDLLT